MNITIIPEKLRSKRESLNLSQCKLSALAGLPNNAVFRMEKKDYKVSFLRASAIAVVLNCSVSDFSDYVEGKR